MRSISVHTLTGRVQLYLISDSKARLQYRPFLACSGLRYCRPAIVCCPSYPETLVHTGSLWVDVRDLVGCEDGGCRDSVVSKAYASTER